MKYIKKFESQAEMNDKASKIVNDINDIFIELQDEGFIVRTNAFYEDGSSITVTISKPGPYAVNTNDIKEYVMMFIDYMKSYFGNVSVNYTFKSSISRGMNVEYPDNKDVEVFKVNIGKKYKHEDLYKL